MHVCDSGVLCVGGSKAITCVKNHLLTLISMHLVVTVK